MPSFIDLTGQKFGRLTVKKIAYRKRTKRGDLHIYWECHCDCGSVCAVRPDGLKGGTTRSCGCLQKELIAKQGMKNATHGLRKTPEYTTYNLMKRRCYDIGSQTFDHYGGRGIKVCDRWLESFQNFYEDMGPKPSKKHSLDRIDNNSDYCPENCRWATHKQQTNNTRRNVFVEIDGIEKTLAQWSEFYGISYAMVRSRIHNGWPAIEAITTPPIDNRRKITIDGKIKTIREWCKIYKIRYEFVRSRLSKGWTPERALTTPPTEPMSIEIDGITKTVGQWAKIFGINYNTIRMRLSYGWDLHKAVTTPVNHRRRKK